MQLSPRYGDDPVIRLAGDPSEIVGPAIRQRQRLAETLALFDDDQWAHPSRCEGWTNRDVMVHLESTNGFWAFSIKSGIKGEPSRFLASFDPVASPAKLVAESSVSTTELVERFAASTEALVAVLSAVGDDEWSALAEAPPGHLTVSAVAHHALWDSWVHERDVLLPLGMAPIEADDEVAACLRYGAALGPALAINRGLNKRGTLAVNASDPKVSILVRIDDSVAVSDGAGTGDLTLTGNAVELLEAFSMRRPFPERPAHDSLWMINGVAETFDAELD